MSQSLHNNLIHCVFHKHSSAVQILQDDLLRLNTCVISICNEMHCPCLIANGPGDHIHILFALSSQVTLANLIKEVKRMSCQYLKTLRTNYYKHFRWQNGYGAFPFQANIRIQFSNTLPHRKSIIKNILSRKSLRHSYETRI